MVRPPNQDARGGLWLSGRQKPSFRVLKQSQQLNPSLIFMNLYVYLFENFLFHIMYSFEVISLSQQLLSLTHTKRGITLIKDRNVFMEECAGRLTVTMFTHKTKTVSLHTAITVNNILNTHENRVKRRKWKELSKKIEDLMSKFPNFHQKIKENLYLQPEEKEIQYLLHRMDKHNGVIEISTEKCFIMCGDFYLYQSLSKKLDFGKKYPTRTWRQVDAIDPGYIDFLCKTLKNCDQDLYIAEYICRQRKAYKQDLLKQQQRNQRQEEQRGDGIQESRIRSRQRQQ